MALSDDLKDDVKHIFDDQWQVRKGQKVPEAEDLQLGNHAVELDGTILYADLAESTALVDNHKPHFAAEVYKAYLNCAAKIIRSEKGAITAYDGDRIMAVFIENNRDASAARSALKIRYAVTDIINPALKNQYPKSTYEVTQSVGIDRSGLFITRTGIRGSNDLVWVGRAANYAAKLCSLRAENYTSYITTEVYVQLPDNLKKDSAGNDIWKPMKWPEKDVWVWRSTYHISF